MFPSSFRSAAAYRDASVDTAVHHASPHHLILMLFDGLLQSVRTAQGAMERSDTAVKGQQLGRAVRILEEGLIGALDMKRGGEVAQNLAALYSYCVQRLTHGNLRNDPLALSEVVRLIEPVADGWREMGQPKPALAVAVVAPITPSAPPPSTSSFSAQGKRASFASAYAPGI